MQSSLSSIPSLVNQIKQEIFSNSDHLHSFVSPSAYDTAWLAMIPHPQRRSFPMFQGCLDWVLNNQKECGFWGEAATTATAVVGSGGLPTIDTLPATLACMVALKTWGVGEENIKKGLAFLEENSSMLLKENYDHHRRHHFPRWFAIVFPGMVEIARVAGLEVVFTKSLEAVISSISSQRQQILEMEELVDKYHYPPLLSYLEALPSSYVIGHEDLVVNLSADGSLFQSPSATACLFLATGNQKCMDYLVSLVRRCSYGVPSMYPIDADLIRLCIVNQIQRLGLAEHFTQEIEEILESIYQTYKNQVLQATKVNYVVPGKMHKDSLAFRLLRMQGYNVTPKSFCWFLYDEEMMDHIKRNCECFISEMYNVYRATDLMFSGEYELEQARFFSRKVLQKSLKLTSLNDNLVVFSNFLRVIEHELNLPWIARLDHLDHRMWIEENKVDSLSKSSCLHNDNLIQLAAENYNFRQSFYQKELEELTRWSKEWGLSEMGFGREKTTYCYYAIAASTSLPHDSLVRMIVAKSAILVTVADDFFDVKGSLHDLQILTQAVQRWDGKGLSGHGKIIFRALDSLVNYIAMKHLHQQGTDVTENLRDMWSKAFCSWLVESTWSETGYVPTLDEYLQTGIISIAIHVMALPALCFLNPNLHPNCELKPDHYETITTLLMASARLLNDIQSYQKEVEVGKKNFITLHSKADPEAGIENSIAYVKEKLEEMKQELLELALTHGYKDMPKPCKHFLLSILRVFHMFFHSTNLFDSTADLLQDINKAIYVPV